MKYFQSSVAHKKTDTSLIIASAPVPIALPIQTPSLKWGPDLSTFAKLQCNQFPAQDIVFFIFW